MKIWNNYIPNLLRLKKAFNTVNRTNILQLLDKYGYGNQSLTLIEDYWNKQTIFLKHGTFYGTPLTAHRGVTQGDILSPGIFNIIVDIICRNIVDDIKVYAAKKYMRILH